MARVLSKPAQIAGKQKWSDFSTRLASAMVLAPVVLLALWRGGLAWDMLIGVTVAGLGSEWAKLTRQRQVYTLPASLLLVWIVALVLGWAAGLLLLAGLTAMMIRSEGKFAAVGLPYVGIGGISLLWLRLQPEYGLGDTLFLVAVIWATDIGAYLAGRVMGGPRLAPKISPGKTWSGSIGGLLAGGMCGAAFAASWQGMNWLMLPAALVLSLFAQAGDLLESAIKRKLGVKDSGNTIPGHGGLFDRLDGFLAAAPLAVLLALLVQGGGAIWR